MNIFEHIDGLVSGKLAILRMVLDIVKLETRLAGLSVYPLLLNLSMLLIVLMTTWLVSMVLMGYGLLLAFESFVVAILSVLVLNVVLLGILLNYLSFNLKKMSFEKTREYFSEKAGNEHDKLEKTNNCEVGSDRKKIKVPTNQSNSA